MDTCAGCGNTFPISSMQCPHCGRFAGAPNVRTASRSEEKEALQTRYDAAIKRAQLDGRADIVESFESVVLSQSRAVVYRSLDEAVRLSRSDQQGYTSFYKLLHAGARFPSGESWDRLRMLADVELFGAASEDIRFAALSLGGTDLPHYGPVTMVFRDTMICDRTTVFEENSAVFIRRARERAEEPPRLAGYRATWENRARLAVAKCGDELKSKTQPEEFPSVLMRPGSAGGEDDVFVEVHIYGPLTRRSLSQLIVRSDGMDAGGSPALLKDLRDRMNVIGVDVAGA